MRVVSDISGQRFGRLVAIRQVDDPRRGAYFLFRCDCGVEKVISASHARRGKSKSCGCARTEKATEILKRHGDSYAHLYKRWVSMHVRCKNKTHPRYKNWGAKGITVCDEWSSYNAFKQWALENGYGPDLSLDRIDPDKNYEPENCRWVTTKLQSQNTKRNIRVMINSVEMFLSDAAKTRGISHRKAYYELKQGRNPFA